MDLKEKIEAIKELKRMAYTYETNDCVKKYIEKLEKIIGDVK